MTTFRLIVDAEPPQVFGNSNGFAAALNQDGTVNSADNPAMAGSIVTIWATAAGTFSNTNGQVAAAADSCCSCGITDAHGTVAQVLYAGAAPGLVNGVTQINFQIPVTDYFVSPNGPFFYLSIGSQKSYRFLLYATQ